MRNRDEILVEVKGLSKKFCRSLKRGMWYGLKDVSKAMLGMEKYGSGLRYDEFWAVKDVSFQLKRGECIGLIGHNGSGKSTLLKMLNGLIRPDEGGITIRGKVGALIELGAGFNPILTGKENIYINGQLIGFSKKQIDEKLDSILAFAEIGSFIDSPVQNYSSGMKVRLGFAIASQMEPDVLLIDEVLAVGDVGFQGKCMKVIHELMNQTAVIFVSHSMPHVNRHCNRGILMNGGKVEVDSPNVQDAIDRYQASFEKDNIGNRFNSGQLILNSFSCNGRNLDEGAGEIDLFGTGLFQVTITRKDSSLKYLKIKLNIIDKNHLVIGSIISDQIEIKNDTTEVRIEAGPFNLKPNRYKISLVVFAGELTNLLLEDNAVYTVEIKGEKDYSNSFVLFHSKTN